MFRFKVTANFSCNVVKLSYLGRIIEPEVFILCFTDMLLSRDGHGCIFFDTIQPNPSTVRHNYWKVKKYRPNLTQPSTTNLIRRCTQQGCRKLEARFSKKKPNSTALAVAPNKWTSTRNATQSITTELIRFRFPRFSEESVCTFSHCCRKNISSVINILLVYYYGTSNISDPIQQVLTVQLLSQK